MSDIKTIRPASGADEWGKTKINLFYGCEHKCKYCYARPINVVRFNRITDENWTNPTLKEEVLKKNYRKREGIIMFPTTHDITEKTLGASLTLLKKLLEAKNEVLIVSKPHLSIIKILCSELFEYKNQIEFRFTIGSTNDNVLKFWEENAPLFNERLESLKHAFNEGFRTSVSCEPMLDENIDDVIKNVKQFVTTSIWLGRANLLHQRLRSNYEGDTETIKKADELLSYYTDERLMEIYNKYKDDKLIKFKDSIKKVVGLERPIIAGLNI